MRTIERPMSTTAVLEILFHECKTGEEVKNSLAGYSEDDIVVYMRSFDPNTFQPKLYVMLRHPTKPVAEWLKYAYPLELSPFIKKEET